MSDPFLNANYAACNWITNIRKNRATGTVLSHTRDRGSLATEEETRSIRVSFIPLLHTQIVVKRLSFFFSFFYHHGNNCRLSKQKINPPDSITHPTNQQTTTTTNASLNALIISWAEGARTQVTFQVSIWLAKSLLTLRVKSAVNSEKRGKNRQRMSSRCVCVCVCVTVVHNIGLYDFFFIVNRCSFLS